MSEGICQHGGGCSCEKQVTHCHVGQTSFSGVDLPPWKGGATLLFIRFFFVFVFLLSEQREREEFRLL